VRIGQKLDERPPAARGRGIKSDSCPPINEVVTSRRLIVSATSALLLAVACAAACLLTRPGDWRPLSLVGMLFVLAVVSEMVTVEIRGIRISGAFLALALAMVLLGPAPAVAIGCGSACIDALMSRRSADRALVNVATYATFPLVGGVLADLLNGGSSVANADTLTFAAVVLVVFITTNVLNFLMIATAGALAFRVSLQMSLREVFVTVLPSEFAMGLLTAGVAFSYGRIGIGAVGLAAVVLLVFQYLLRAGIDANVRGQELEERTRQLASLQVGLLSTVLQTLSMRDAMTARHSTAVARYSREVARMLGLDEREQDLIHTAALLHDIGKFIFPDSILFAERKLTDEEWEIVKLHPEQGAKLVARIEGYGPVAEIVRHHHERFGGGGYPDGIAGGAIPIGSRIIAVADTYDVMTARDSYRRPVSPEAALVELERVAGTQLDPAVVGAFTRMIAERRVAFSHVDGADFERELAFERRVADHARPRAAAA
jgi:putative nucleotidyltransferase with HDIG domain